MNKRQYISSLLIGSRVDDTFIVAKKQIFKKKDGKDYCRLVLQDKTGKINAIIWTETLNQYGRFEQGDLVVVKGEVTSFEDEKQININKIEKIQLDLLSDLSDYIRVTSHDINTLKISLLEIIKEIKNPYLSKLLDLIFDQDFMTKFENSAAAVSFHHAYKGGLIEHTLSIAKSCLSIADRYPNVNRDILLTGAIIHDVGKVYEYSTRHIIEQTDQGKLLGHIAIGYNFVSQKIDQIEDFPQELKMHILHILLSHHGQLEYGSPQTPKTREAFIVFHLDNLDADIAGFEALSEETQDSDWSKYAKNFDGQLYLKTYSRKDEEVDI
ncbi:MAG: HD domain-containing protein [Actinobacteria bacterium]|nr:HD domain-containing protein [Actinomycetota bacterium]